MKKIPTSEDLGYNGGLRLGKTPGSEDPGYSAGYMRYNPPVVRTRRIEEHGRIFFLTTNLHRGVPQLSANERTFVLDVLAAHRKRGDFFLYGYVVMPDHVHLLIWPQGKSLSHVVRDWKSKTGYEIAQHRRATGSIWQPRFFDNIIRRVRHFWEKLDYIHKNPVEATLVPRPEQWEWSSYRYYLNCGPVPILPDPVELPADGNALLWPAPWS